MNVAILQKKYIYTTYLAMPSFFYWILLSPWKYTIHTLIIYIDNFFLLRLPFTLVSWDKKNVSYKAVTVK